MNVGELIEKLKTFDPEMEVRIRRTWDDDEKDSVWDDLEDVRKEEHRLLLQQNVGELSWCKTKYVSIVLGDSEVNFVQIPDFSYRTSEKGEM